MSRILSTFSNLTGDLQSLKTEFSGLFRLFNEKEIKQKVDYEPYLNEPISDITSHVVGAQKDLSLFHFSGHSQGTGLDFPDAEFDQDHLVRFFSTINSDTNKLDCVFLNGCENEDIVNRLDHVPIVIGTKTKIEDEVAEKFTRDFFNSLIKSESTYRQAFNDAAAAQTNINTSVTNRTRSGGGAADLLETGALNEYFMVINDPKVANRQFPFKKKPTNYNKLIFGILALVIIAATALFWNDIMGIIKGYTCPTWDDDEKCRILVADFNAEIESGFDLNELIAEELQFNPKIRDYIEPQYTASFADYTGGGGGEKLHQTCDYEFSLTGDLTRDNEQIYMDFRIFSDFEEFIDMGSEEIEIGGLRELKEMIQSVDLENGNHFIVNRLCIACAQKRPELIEFIEENMKVYKDRMTTPESYQNLNIELFSLHQKREDTTKMLKTLANIANVGNNDYVLGALDREEQLLRSSRRFEDAYMAQTRYIGETEKRLENPRAYQMKFDSKRYDRQRNKMLLKRATNVRMHPDLLNDKLRQALNDYRYLKEIGHNGKDYLDEIGEVERLLGGTVIYPPIEERPVKQLYTFKGLVEDCNHGSTIAKSISINDRTIKLSRSVYYDTLTAYPGTQITIRPPRGFMFQQGAEIQMVLGENEVIDETLVLVKEPKKVRVLGRVVTNGDPIPGVNVTLLNSRSGSKTDTKGGFSITDDIDLCSVLRVAIPGAQAKEIQLKNFDVVSITGRGSFMRVGDVDIGSNGRTPEPEELVYEVNLQAGGGSQVEYRKILAQIRRAGHPVSNESKYYDQVPTSWPQKGRVLYYDRSLAGKAKEVHAIMREMTGQSLDFQFVEQHPSRMMTHIPKDMSKFIIVQHPHRILID